MEQIKETIDELRQKIGALETERQQAEQAALEANAALRVRARDAKTRGKRFLL